ncbi:hypothetical protein [Rhodococcus sp. IEGM 1408]|uniref:hypothetical protein n=1 Tax=Rhodococcus sp. IEGM 1408 TaxID=3082220 RepID=UPI00295316F3|nr:hypothetical protein [Rhodococcus sp. IEGM 1408]MDV8003014.1 hypothetical protein [Rhodococcus sp. IEGM 1408]
MKPVEGKVLLDHWQPPPGAGAPIAVFAATFALEADFVDRDCLSRFLSVTGVDESPDGGTSRTVDDIVARIELEDLLGTVTVTVLADRSSVQARSTLRWDLLPCSVPNGLMHSKVAVMMWENSTRVLIGSANLTSAGYRRQVEVMLPIDLGPDCLLARPDLTELADELRSYLDLIPGYGPGLPAWDRANASLELFRDRIEEVPMAFGRRRLRTILAPSSPLASDAGRSPRRPLERFEDVWRSFARPKRLAQVSPYFDMDDERATQAIVEAILPRRGRHSCTHEVLTLLDYFGTVPVPRHLRDRARTRLLYVADTERRLHAKSLLAESRDGVAVLVGSSNHTAKGLGIGATDKSPGHREMNVWVCAPAGSQESRALLALSRGGESIGPEVESCTADQLRDEDEDAAVPLPTGFRICRAVRTSASTDSWVLRFEVDAALIRGLDTWTIRVRGVVLYDARQWRNAGRPGKWEVSLESSDLPTAVDVEWERRRNSSEEVDGAASAVWAVVVDDLSALPPSPDVSRLPASVLFSALSRGRSLSEAVAELLAENEAATADPQRIDLLALHDDPSYLLRRGRALATALDGLEKRLSAPLIHFNDPDHLRRRLFSTLGPVGLISHLLRDVGSGAVPVSEAAFTIAEIALVCSRVPWEELIDEGDTETWGVLADALGDMRASASTLTNLPESFRDYQSRAFERAESCIAT